MDLLKIFFLFLYFVVNLLLFSFSWHYSTYSWIYLQKEEFTKKKAILKLSALAPTAIFLRECGQAVTANWPTLAGNKKQGIWNVCPLPPPPTPYPPCLIAVLGIRQADKKGEALSLQDGFWGIEWDKLAWWWRRRGRGGGLMPLWDGATAWSITSQQPIPPPCMQTCVRVR